jgi:hypothetical protein
MAASEAALKEQQRSMCVRPPVRQDKKNKLCFLYLCAAQS